MDHDAAAPDANQEGVSYRNKLADLPPISTTTNDVLPQPSEYRKCLRPRPSQLLQDCDAEPLSPVSRPTRQRSLQHRGTKMSLFGLFSKPKVEKMHGYAEQVLHSPSSRALEARGERPTEPAASPGATPDIESRPPTSMSSWTTGSKPLRTKSSMPDVKPRQWAPPPLFQVYPQASKHGIMQVSTVADTLAAVAKAQKAAGLRTQDLELSSDAMAYSNAIGSKPTRTGIDSSTRPRSNPVETLRKIVVLVTSGYLLQYADYGPSDRLPERILQLGKDSAAFACDMIPGKHYVLQVSHAVNSQGMPITNTGGMFSKWGMKRAASRKTTATLLLVMEDHREMDSWMMTIREEIKILGGSRLRPATVEAVLGATADGSGKLSKSPSLSHRYNIARASGLTNPSRQGIEHMPPQAQSREEEQSFAQWETNTIDDIEQEMERTAKERPGSAFENQQQDSDAQSLRSSIALSAEHHQLRSPQSSSCISHSTFATTAANSRTSSPNDLHLAGSEKWSSDSSRESEPGRSSYLPRSSPGLGTGKRRSVVPSVAKKEQSWRSPDMNTSVQSTAVNVGLCAPTKTVKSLTPPRKLVVTASEPNLRAAMEGRSRHDSRLQDVTERPLSIIADLPSSAQFNVHSPNKRQSLMQAAAAQTQAYRYTMRTPDDTLTATSAPGNTATVDDKRNSQRSCIPLKVNLKGTVDRSSSESGARRGQVDNNVDVSHRLSRTSSTTSEALQTDRGRSSPGRLSLFPSQAHPALIHDSSLPATTPLKRPSPDRIPTQSRAIILSSSRPASMQVRADHTPFLNCYGASLADPEAPNAHATPTRNLKPSRSSHAISTQSSVRVPRPQLSPTDPFMKPPTRASHTHASSVPEDEAGDCAMPLPRPCASPMLVRPVSRQCRSGLKSKTSLPELDLGMPVVGLGPPPPPPSAPLPRPPSAESRSRSPMAMRGRNAGGRGLGISH